MAMKTMNIKLVSHEIIKPSCPTPNHLRLLQASLFDHVNSPTLMPLIFFFNSQKASTKISTNEVLYRLKGSLPNTLSMFYPLAGRMQDANYFICNDEGVPYVHSTVDLLMDDVVHMAEVCELDKLLPSYGQEGFSNLLLAIQVNVFACGGIAIGVKMNHVVSDAFSLTMFVKTWASIANNNGNYHHALLGCPNFEICKLFPPSKPRKVNGIDVFANQDTRLIKDRPMTKWFMFHKGKLNALKSTLSSSSTNLVLSAFIWSRIKVACHKSANDIPYQVFHSVNLRRKLAPPNDEQSYYFGNIFVNAVVKLSMIQVLNDDKINDNNISNCQRDFLNQMNESIGKVINNDKFIREMQDGKEDLKFITQHFERVSKGDIVALGFSNLRSLRVYEADFGWGMPIWVTSATLMFKNLVILIPAGPSSNNIVAYINLSSEDMAKLENDKEFIAVVSKAPHATTELYQSTNAISFFFMVIFSHAV
ncbi:acetyl-CoA-benzylalcohol acetyltransferase-like [Chenopodium quinoa]|uniref:acetyl-CoA-benzylalcohol acetyltransferase-like n=1 Tax=Chenopodium quinoa TaxID=63459 RepID=UPI000B7851B5|nr:acetyl-CoA-benzylalcohol acetyltransferase-like [Chenopodium quinoa]